jgi:hypothetical protein
MWSYLSVIRPLQMPIPMCKKKFGFRNKNHRKLLIVIVYYQQNS